MGHNVSAIAGVKSPNFYEQGNAINEIWVDDVELISRLPFGDSDLGQAGWPKGTWPKIPWHQFIIPLKRDLSQLPNETMAQNATETTDLAIQECPYCFNLAVQQCPGHFNLTIQHGPDQFNVTIPRCSDFFSAYRHWHLVVNISLLMIYFVNFVIFLVDFWRRRRLRRQIAIVSDCLEEVEARIRDLDIEKEELEVYARYFDDEKKELE